MDLYGQYLKCLIVQNVLDTFFWFEKTELEQDLEVLIDFFAAEHVPWQHMREERVWMIKYGFGDASGAGFGAWFEEKDGFWYRMGVWGSDEKGQLSNYRKL